MKENDTVRFWLKNKWRCGTIIKIGSKWIYINLLGKKVKIHKAEGLTVIPEVNN